MNEIRAYFGFTAEPCTREIRVDHHFRLQPYDEALEALLDTVQRRQSAALIAPAGTGKSQLLRALVDRLPEARYRVRYVKVTDLSKRDMCREIACALGCEPKGSYNWLVRVVQDHFANHFDVDGVRPVLILDEAHDMRPDVLGLLRVLTNYDMDSRLVLSVVLAGQPELAAMLRKPQLEAIARRIAHYATLRTLSRDETARYVEHRCVVAGATELPFDGASLDAVYEIGGGNLRATDRLVSKALHLAAKADAKVVDTTHVVNARRNLWP
jgi:general secretion pathway protein A